jgi:hypothetical protein
LPRRHEGTVKKNDRRNLLESEKKELPRRHEGTKLFERDFLEDEKNILPRRHEGMVKKNDRRNLLESEKKELPLRHEGTKGKSERILFLFKIMLVYTSRRTW